MYGPEVQQSAFERGYMKGYADALAEAPTGEDTLDAKAKRVLAFVTVLDRAPATDQDWLDYTVHNRVAGA